MKRAPLRPTAFHRKEPPCSRSEHPRAKDKECAAPNCEVRFIPKRMEHVVCSPGCLIAKRKADALAEKERRKAEKVSDRARKEAIKTIPDLIRDTDKEFAGYIRLRDRLAGHPCISSGRPLDWTGNQVDAGHYRSRGAASHLRYNEDNAHAQSKHDNQFKAGNVVEYRIRLIARIGLARVEALEADNAVHRWTRQELLALKTEFRAKRRALNQLNATP